MAEREFEIRQVGVDYICDGCNTGAMLPTGVMLLCAPPKWPHKCNHCGAEATFSVKYPSVRFERSEAVPTRE